MRPVEKDPPDGSVGISFQFPHFRHLVHRGISLSRAMSVERRTETHVDQAHSHLNGLEGVFHGILPSDIYPWEARAPDVGSGERGGRGGTGIQDMTAERSTLVLVLRQQRLEAGVVAEGIVRWIDA